MTRKARVASLAVLLGAAGGVHLVACGGLVGKTQAGPGDATLDARTAGMDAGASEAGVAKRDAGDADASRADADAGGRASICTRIVTSQFVGPNPYRKTVVVRYTAVGGGGGGGGVDVPSCCYFPTAAGGGGGGSSAILVNGVAVGVAAGGNGGSATEAGDAAAQPGVNGAIASGTFELPLAAELSVIVGGGGGGAALNFTSGGGGGGAGWFGGGGGGAAYGSCGVSAGGGMGGTDAGGRGGANCAVAFAGDAGGKTPETSTSQTPLEGQSREDAAVGTGPVLEAPEAPAASPTAVLFTTAITRKGSSLVVAVAWVGAVPVSAIGCPMAATAATDARGEATAATRPLRPVAARTEGSGRGPGSARRRCPTRLVPGGEGHRAGVGAAATPVWSS